MKKVLVYILVLSLCITGLFSILGYLGQSSWKLDLLSHFKWQYLLILVVGIIILLLAKKKLALIFIPFVIPILFEIAPLYFGGNKVVSLNESFKIICINLLSSNSQFENVEKYIKRQNPDLVVLQEFNTLWQLMLEPKLHDYSFRLTIPRDDNFGIAVYSKIDVKQLKELQIGDSGVPSILGEIELKGIPIKIITTHPLPPVDSWYFNRRNIQLYELANFVSEVEEEVIVIGDLNTSSFSSHFKHLITKAELIDSRRGFGQLTTWPTWLTLASTTLDHCLVTDGIYIKSRGVGEDIGSDHLPIHLELGIK